MAFKDLFSAGATDYARYRPTYPPALFAWLAEVSPGRALALDVGTGNGQAAVALAAHFDQVIGQDPSDKQLGSAQPHPNVRYQVARAERTGLDSGSVDLITACQCFHWFDGPAFFAEAARVLRPQGIVALVSYGLSEITAEVDRAVHALYDELNEFWEPERRLVEEGYRHVQAPLPEIAAPPFAMQLDWSVDQLLGFLGTWSPLPRYRQARGRDPLAEAAPAIAAAWGDAPTRPVVWPLAARVFRVE
jgi:SAM-dependent methyltransferase